MPVEDFSVREIGSLRPVLREGICFSVQEQGGQRFCLIEDPAASRFHRVGLAEYRFIRALDGRQAVAAILAQLARENGETFSEAEAVRIVRWLRDQHLLEVESSRSGLNPREQDHQALQSVITWLNPLVCKIPLFHPDRFFTQVEPLLRPFLGWGGFVFWLVLVLAGATHVSMDWRRFVADADGLFSRENWIWLFVAWTGLKIAHEFSHGLFCKHYGAAVREAGVITVVFVPMGYIDATASLGLPSRWRRMMIAAAGLYMEFFLAALAAIIWARTSPGALNTLAHNVVVIGTVVTLFFNANPLMRFDGYYLLSDLLEVPNLATRGRTWWQRTLMWILIGGRDGRPLWPSSQAAWIAAIYGCLAWFWQIVVLGGCLVAGSVALRGGGLILAALAGCVWMALPLVRFGKMLAERIHAGVGSGAALLLRGSLLLAVVAGILFVPWRPVAAGDGVIELTDTDILRTECPGFILREWVRDGDLVKAGQLLVELGNDEATTELAQRRFALERQELRARLAYTRNDVATFQAERASIEALRKEIAERAVFLSTLQIRAPFAGRVTNRQLGRRNGVFLSPGDEILRLGRAEGREVKLAISEREEPHFRAAVGATVQVRMGTRELILPGRLVRIEARASRHPTHPALTALFGGPLALRRTEESSVDRSGPLEGYELAWPCFTATVQIDAVDDLAPGELAQVRFRSTVTHTLWGTSQRVLHHWLRRSTTR